MSYIRLSQIKKSFGKTEVIKSIGIEIDRGDFICFVGPSGCGKSTLLRMIAGLERQDSGEIWIDGQNVTSLPPAKRGIAMVFQTYALYPHLNVFNNMALALKQAKVPKPEIQQRVDEASAMLKLESLLERYPSELSGGQRQRVAIGRSIVRKPKVFLLDEPLSNLDAALRVEVRVSLAKLHSELDTTMIYVTHDQVEAMTLANKVVILNQGRVEQVGTPMEVYFKPVNTFVASFIGTPKMNLNNCRYSEGGIVMNCGFRIAKTLPLRNDESLILGVRPQFWQIADEGMGIKVLMSEKLGSETYLYGETEREDLVTVKIPGTESYSVGTRLKIIPDIENSQFFDSQGNRINLS